MLRVAAWLCWLLHSPQVSLPVRVSGGTLLAVPVPLHPLVRDGGFPAPWPWGLYGMALLPATEWGQLVC